MLAASACRWCCARAGPPGAWLADPGDAQVRISRRRVLESAAKVFEMYGAGRAVLEIEYFGEVGTGLGPTLEFYTLLSHELQRRGLGLWRCDDGSLAAAGVRPPRRAFRSRAGCQGEWSPGAWS